MERKKANLVLTDPPYNVNYKGSAGTIQNDNWSDGEAFYHFLLDAFTNMEKVMANHYCFAMRGHDLPILKKLVDNVWPKISSGEVKPTIYKILPIREAEAAHNILYQGQNVGKVVLRVE